MAFVLVLVFLCLIHWVEPTSQNHDFSGTLWYPSNIFRFTRPSTSGRSISRPVPLLYGPSIQSIQRPFNPFIRLDIQNKKDAFIPMFAPTAITLAPTTSTPVATMSTPTYAASAVTTTSAPIYATMPLSTTSTAMYATSEASTRSTPKYATTLPSQPVEFCNSTTAPLCADQRFGFCISDDQYPLDKVNLATQSSQLADTFSSKSIGDDEWISLLMNSINNTGCVTTSLVAKPLRARNIDGDWRVIVQSAKNIYQWQHMVLCGNQHAHCHHLEQIIPMFCFKGICRQMFIVRQLLAFDPCHPNREVFIDSFSLPSECSCRLSRMPCVYKYDV